MYGREGQATEHNVIRRMRSACCITEATNTHSEYVIIIVFYRHHGYANWTQYNVIWTMSAIVQSEFPVSSFSHRWIIIFPYASI